MIIVYKPSLSNRKAGVGCTVKMFSSGTTTTKKQIKFYCKVQVKDTVNLIFKKLTKILNEIKKQKQRKMQKETKAKEKAVPITN